MLLFERGNEKTVYNNNLSEKKIEQVEDVVYLGSLFSTDGRLNGEILRCMNEGKVIVGIKVAIILPKRKILRTKQTMKIYTAV